MTLHEAIEKLLRQAQRPMTIQQIADALNRNGWYEKKDGSKITAYQIHGRTKNYPNIFHRDGSIVSLVRQTNVTKQVSISRPVSKPITPRATVKAEPSSHLKKSFAPMVVDDTEILILGTMPGELSLKLGEYYAHPRNRFWKIIAAITDRENPTTYDEKISLLIKNKIGLWDVAKAASRKGSLDNDIFDVEANDIDGFLRENKKIKVIGFNGSKAMKLFALNFSRQDKITYLSFRSTSPANTTISFEQICNDWKRIFEYTKKKT